MLERPSAVANIAEAGLELPVVDVVVGVIAIIAVLFAVLLGCPTTSTDKAVLDGVSEPALEVVVAMLLLLLVVVVVVVVVDVVLSMLVAKELASTVNDAVNVVSEGVALMLVAAASGDVALVAAASGDVALVVVAAA